MTKKNAELPVLDAIINKVQTTADGGARITLDLGYESSDVIKQLLVKKMSGNDMIKIVLVE